MDGLFEPRCQIHDSKQHTLVIPSILASYTQLSLVLKKLKVKLTYFEKMWNLVIMEHAFFRLLYFGICLFSLQNTWLLEILPANVFQVVWVVYFLLGWWFSRVWQHSFSIRLRSSRNSGVRPCSHCNEKQSLALTKNLKILKSIFLFLQPYSPLRHAKLSV